VRSGSCQLVGPLGEDRGRLEGFAPLVKVHGGRHPHTGAVDDPAGCWDVFGAHDDGGQSLADRVGSRTFHLVFAQLRVVGPQLSMAASSADVRVRRLGSVTRGAECRAASGVGPDRAVKRSRLEVYPPIFLVCAPTPVC
jgi:hypothetical protein